MAITIESAEVSHLVEELASLTGETPEESLRAALGERLARIRARPTEDRAARLAKLRVWLAREVWPTIPSPEISQQSEAEILGYGEDGF